MPPWAGIKLTFVNPLISLEQGYIYSNAKFQVGQKKVKGQGKGYGV